VQLRFITNSLERMRELVAADLAAGTPRSHQEAAPPVRPASADSAAAEKVEELREEEAEARELAR
jgi:hypothetical protein